MNAAALRRRAHEALDELIDAQAEVAAARAAYDAAKQPVGFMQEQALLDRRSAAKRREGDAYFAVHRAITKAVEAERA
jgi:hypothetical protein